MKLFDSLGHVYALAGQVTDFSKALALAEEAYDVGAALPGIIMSAVGATPTAADDNALGGLMDLMRMSGEAVAAAALTCETLSQSAGTIAMNLRKVEDFLAQLYGKKPLRDVLEDGNA